MELEEMIPGGAQGPGFVKMQSVHFVLQGNAVTDAKLSKPEHGQYHNYTKNIIVFQKKSLVQVKLTLIIERTARVHLMAVFFFIWTKSQPSF